VIAIGGMTKEKGRSLEGTGVAGMAVSTSFFNMDDCGEM